MSTNNKRPRVSSRRARSSSRPKTDDRSPFIAVEHSGRRVIVVRSISYPDTLASIKKAFKELETHADDQIQLFVKLEKLPNRAQAVEELWSELVPSLLSVKVVVTTPLPLIVDAFPKSRVPITIIDPSGKSHKLRVSLKCTVKRLKTVVQEHLLDNLPEDQFKLEYYDMTLPAGGSTTLADNGVESGDVIHVSCAQERVKPEDSMS